MVLWEGLCDKERFKLILKESEGSTWQKKKKYSAKSSLGKGNSKWAGCKEIERLERLKGQKEGTCAWSLVRELLKGWM